MRKVFLGSDHGGYALKEKVKKELILRSSALQLAVEDLGTFDDGSVDYPDYASEVAKRIHSFQLVDSKDTDTNKQTTGPIPLPVEVGILICGSGQGMCMRANRYPHIRAALCWNEESTKLAREHNDANILCLGGRLVDHDLAQKMVDIFLTTYFAGDRHLRRVLKLGGPL